MTKLKHWKRCAFDGEPSQSRQTFEVRGTDGRIVRTRRLYLCGSHTYEFKRLVKGALQVAAIGAVPPSQYPRLLRDLDAIVG